MPKYSIIVVASNGITHTVKCIESILRCSKNYELVIVDNNTNDGTKGYLQSLNEKLKEVSVIETKKNLTFAENNNLGVSLAKGDYIVFLNNDTIVCDEWLDRLEAHFTNIKLKDIGAVGPVTSSSNGRQAVGIQDAEVWHKKYKGRWSHTGVLYGWCMMVKKSVIDKVGKFDERFENSHEDNDLCLRIQLAGYKLIIAQDTYIYHLGQGTLRQTISMKEYSEKGFENRERYYDKWASKKINKLVAVYRTNGGQYLERSLEQTSKFADSIIIHFCRSGWTKEKMEGLRVKFPKIIKIGVYEGIFQEDYERGWLLGEAVKLQKEGKADWCISIDDDEIYEDKFINRVQKMMSPRNPEIMAYWCNWRTIWERRLDKEYYRADSTFGRFANYRFFKLIQGQEIYSHHPEGHHCGSAPLIADENLKWCNIRVKHLGYDTPEQRQKKYEFYEKNDNFKTKTDIGYDDYRHLISRNVQLEEYIENNGISFLMMVKNEEEFILSCLEQVQYLVDEYVIVDTGSTDKTLEIVEGFAKHCGVPVKILKHNWVDCYAVPRNFGKFHCTQRWILMMDADERFDPEDIRELAKMTEIGDYHSIMFHVVNYLEKPIPNKKLKYASTESVRLYQNIPEFFYNGVIHETIDDSMVMFARSNKIRVNRCDIVLHHHGYLRERKRVKGKLDYYETLNGKQIEITEKKDPRPYYNLALHYLNDDKEHKALEAFQKSLKVKDNFWHSCQQMAALNIKNAKFFLERSMERIPAYHPFKDEAKVILDFLNKHSIGHVKICQSKEQK